MSFSNGILLDHKFWHQMFWGFEGRKDMFYLTMHSTHFIYGYMVLDIRYRTTQVATEVTRCRRMGYSFRLAARVLLHAPSHRQASTYGQVGVLNIQWVGVSPLHSLRSVLDKPPRESRWVCPGYRVWTLSRYKHKISKNKEKMLPIELECVRTSLRWIKNYIEMCLM